VERIFFFWELKERKISREKKGNSHPFKRPKGSNALEGLASTQKKERFEREGGEMSSEGGAALT